MDGVHLITSSSMEDPTIKTPEHQNVDDDLQGQRFVDTDIDGYTNDVVEKTLHGNDCGNGDDDDRTLTIPGTSKECTPPARYPDDARTKKECDLHVSFDSQTENEPKQTETKPVCASDIIVEFQDHQIREDCEPGTSATVKNMENMAATLRKKPTGSLDAVIPEVGKQHPMKLKLTETTEQKTADLNYPNVAMARPNIGNTMEHKPLRHSMSPATGKTEESLELALSGTQRQNLFTNVSPKLSKMHNGGPTHGNPEDKEILPLAGDVTVCKNEVTDTRTITDDQTKGNELRQETEQENVDNWTDRKSLGPAESDKDQTTSDDCEILDIMYHVEGQAKDSAIPDQDIREQNVHCNQDDIANPITRPTADIDLLDEPGDLDVGGYHLNEIHLHERPQRHAFVGTVINDHDRAFNDHE